MLIDAHTHLDRYDLVGPGGADAALAEIEQRRILTLSNSMDPVSYRRNLEIAAGSDLVLPLFGVHPWNAPSWAERLSELQAPAEASSMLGEVGLDFYFVRDAGAYAAQRQVLEFFLRVARDQDKVLQLHTKGAEAAVLELIDRYEIQRAIVHWYSGPLDLLREFIARSFYFTAGLEVRHSDHVRAVAQEIPLDRLLTETDNPGGPKGYLGRPGMPALIEQVVEGLAEARGVGGEVILRAVQENLLRLLAGDRWIAPQYTQLLQEAIREERNDGHPG
jgi:TatD DNase family protein